MSAALKGGGCSAASFILAEDQDSVRALVSEHATREEPFLFSLEDVSTKGLCLQSQVVSRFFSDHSRLDLPIHLPLQNGTRRTVRDLPVNYLPTEDPGLQKIYKHSGSSVNWFRKPYGRIYLLTCENLADYKKKSRPRLKELIAQSEGAAKNAGIVNQGSDTTNSSNTLLAITPWLVLYLQGASSTPQSQQQHNKIFQMIKDDFNSNKYNTLANSGVIGSWAAMNGKADRVCQLIITPENGVTGWEDLSRHLSECVKLSFNCKLNAYLSEVRNLALLRRTPGWSFDHFFLVKGSLAHMFEQAHVYDEAIREYYELEVIYTDTLQQNGAKGETAESSSANVFGGEHSKDDEASIFDPLRKNLRKLCRHSTPPTEGNTGSLKEFDVRQYLFSKRALLMLKDIWTMPSGTTSKKHELAHLGQRFISSFTRKLQKHNFATPFVDMWVFTACMQLAAVLTMKRCSIASNISNNGKNAQPSEERDSVLNGILADLYISCHSKLLKLSAREGRLSIDTMNDQKLRQGVSKSMVHDQSFASPVKRVPEPSSEDLPLEEEDTQTFEEELILMEAAAAVAAAREAAVIAESAMHADVPTQDQCEISSTQSRRGNAYLLSLVKEAAHACRMCDRKRQATHLEASAFKLYPVSEARKLLGKQCQMYYEEGWLELHSYTAAKLRDICSEDEFEALKSSIYPEKEEDAVVVEEKLVKEQLVEQEVEVKGEEGQDEEVLFTSTAFTTTLAEKKLLVEVKLHSNLPICIKNYTLKPQEKILEDLCQTNCLKLDATGCKEVCLPFVLEHKEEEEAECELSVEFSQLDKPGLEIYNYKFKVQCDNQGAAIDCHYNKEQLRLLHLSTFTFCIPDSRSGDSRGKVAYEIKYNKKDWMVAGQSKGFVEGQSDVSIDCIPLVCGSLPCPQLSLEDGSLSRVEDVLVKQEKTVSISMISV